MNQLKEPPTPIVTPEHVDVGDPAERGAARLRRSVDDAEVEETGERPLAPRAQATVKKNRHFSPIWLAPIVIACVVIYVAYDAIARHGSVITLTFQSADGLVPGETPIKHKNVRLGTVEDVHLSSDLSHVEVRVRVERHESRLLTDRARFWVVRPRFSGGGLAGLQNGLETLMSGAYIAVDPGTPGGHAIKRFAGLEEPPGVRSDEPGRVFTLRADSLGSLSTGSPIYFREVAAGEVLKYDVGNEHSPITMQVFIRAPFDKFVNDKTRFWNVSGLSVNMGPDGLRVQMESIQAFLAGGVAFETPAGMTGGPIADQAVFPLYRDKAAADAVEFENVIPCVAYFTSSVQGLAAGAQVELLGTTIGQVRAVRLVNDPKRPGAWLARVAFDVQPSRVSAAEKATPMTMATLREHPPRVFLESLNLVTGQKALSIDFTAPTGPDAKVTEVSMEGEAIVLPGEGGGGLDNLTASMGRIASKIEQIPFEDIGRNLDATLRSVQSTVGSADMQNAVKELSATMTDVHRLVGEVDQGLTPALAKLPAIADQLQQAIANANHTLGGAGYGADSDFQRNVQRLMKQVSEAARSVRQLADFLDRHPESLLRGRSSETSAK